MDGHCIRHHELSPHPLILWEPTQGKANIGVSGYIYIYIYIYKE